MFSRLPSVIARRHRALRIFLELDPTQPPRAPVDDMRTTASRGPTAFNAGSQSRASQPQASEVGSAFCAGAPWRKTNI